MPLLVAVFDGSGLSTGPAWPSQTHHIYRLALGQPSPPLPLTFIDRAQASLALACAIFLLAGPDPHFYWLALAKFVRAGGARSGRAARAEGGKVGSPTPF